MLPKHQLTSFSPEVLCARWRRTLSAGNYYLLKFTQVSLTRSRDTELLQSLGGRNDTRGCWSPDRQHSPRTVATHGQLVHQGVNGSPKDALKCRRRSAEVADVGQHPRLLL